MKHTKEEVLEAREMWLQALESGNYTQGNSSLYQLDNDVESFCCLGVACKVLGEKINLDDKWQHHSYLPIKLSNFLGVRQQVDLSILNDMKELSFFEIAKHIRENYDKFFNGVE